MTVYCTSCKQPCDIDDGSVEPHLMRGAHYKPYAPASDCCGADFTEDNPAMTITDHIEALDLTLEDADGSDTITLAYATVEELRDTLAWAEHRMRIQDESLARKRFAEAMIQEATP